jgi:hypothetical protein
MIYPALQTIGLAEFATVERRLFLVARLLSKSMAKDEAALMTDLVAMNSAEFSYQSTACGCDLRISKNGHIADVALHDTSTTYRG